MHKSIPRKSIDAKYIHTTPKYVNTKKALREYNKATELTKKDSDKKYVAVLKKLKRNITPINKMFVPARYVTVSGPKGGAKIAFHLDPLSQSEKNIIDRVIESKPTLFKHILQDIPISDEYISVTVPKTNGYSETRVILDRNLELYKTNSYDNLIRSGKLDVTRQQHTPEERATLMFSDENSEKLVIKLTDEQEKLRMKLHTSHLHNEGQLYKQLLTGKFEKNFYTITNSKGVPLASGFIKT